LIFSVFFDTHVKRIEDLEFVLEHFARHGVVDDVNISSVFLEFLVHQSKNALGLEELFNETHITVELQILILFNSNAKDNGGSFAEVHPEIRIFSLSNEVLEDVLIRGSRVLRSGSRLSELSDELKLLGDTVSKFAI
jgi:hypothetical protein